MSPHHVDDYKKCVSDAAQEPYFLRQLGDGIDSRLPLFLTEPARKQFSLSSSWYIYNFDEARCTFEQWAELEGRSAPFQRSAPS